MSKWKDSKPVVVPLGIVAVAVWSLVGYTLVSAWPHPEAQSSVAQIGESGVVEVIAHVWRDDFRDPFFHTSPRPPVNTPEQRDQQSAAIEGPLLRLLGIVDGTAMIEGPDGAVYLANAGSNVLGVHVSSVSDSFVRVQENGTTRTLSLK